MKELQTSLRGKHIDELQTITNLITELVQPCAIVLFGHYAGSKHKSAIGGYEILIITPDCPTVSVTKIRQHIYGELNEKRTGVPVHLYLFSVGFISKNYYPSFFLHNISQDGILLYRNPAFTASIFPKKGTLRISNVYHTARKNFSRHFESGQAFLENARENIKSGTHEAAGFALYLALYQYFIALEYIYFGFHIDSRDLVTLFKRIRHASGEINEYLNLSVSTNKVFLTRLSRYSKAIFRQPEAPDTIHKNSMVQYLNRAEEIEVIVREEWEARELFYQSLYPKPTSAQICDN